MADVLKMYSSIDEFNAILVKQNSPYILAGVLPADKIYLQFEGALNGEAVVWNACVRTIEEYAQSHLVDNDPKQFIDIKIQKKCFLLQIALNIKFIDKAVIERTIIMIRKYKQLQVGHHEYGVRSKTQE